MAHEWIGRTEPADEPPEEIHVTHLTFGRPDVPFADLDRVGCLLGFICFSLPWLILYGIGWIIWKALT